MYRFKRIVVGITLGDQDEAKIRYAAVISRLASSEKIFFIHVISQEDKDKEYKGLKEVAEESIRHRMEEIMEMDIDLLVLGKIRGELTKRGTIPVKVARKAPCSVLFVPVGIKPESANILVPVDFSDISQDAMEVAVTFAVASDVRNIRCINIYNVPIGYYEGGKSYEEFAEIMRGHAETNFKKFIDKIDMRGINVTPVFKLGRNVRETIDEYVRQYHIDLLIVGARGRRTGAAFVLGSITEKLICSTSMPILAVKKKGEGMSFFEALLRL